MDHVEMPDREVHRELQVHKVRQVLMDNLELTESVDPADRQETPGLQDHRVLPVRP